MSVRMQAWLIIGGLVAAVFLSNPSAFLPDTTHHRVGQPRPDFVAFYSAGVLLREKPGHLYDERQQADIQSNVLGETVTPGMPGFMPFAYPAIVALFFLPLSALPYPAAFVGMLVVNVLLCGFALGLLSRRFRLSAGTSRLLVLCAALSIPVISTLANGQVSFLVFLLYIMLIGDIRDGNARAGVWTGLLAFKPTLIPVFLLWFLSRRDWRSLWYATIAGSAVFLTSLLLVGTDALAGYWAMSLKMVTGEYATVNPAHMPNLRSLSAFMGYGETIEVLLSLLVLVLLLRKAGETSDASCAALILATVLLARHIHYQDLNPLWIIAAIGMSRLSDDTRWWQWALLGGTLLTTARLFTTAFYQLNLPILPMCLLVLFLIITLRPKPSVALA